MTSTTKSKKRDGLTIADVRAWAEKQIASGERQLTKLRHAPRATFRAPRSGLTRASALRLAAEAEGRIREGRALLAFLDAHEETAISPEGEKA